MSDKKWVKRWKFNIDPKLVKQALDDIENSVKFLQNRAEAWVNDENDFTIEDAEAFDEVLNQLGFLMGHAGKAIKKTPMGYTVKKEI